MGKGYAGELAAELLREAGVSSALLDLGGNIQAVGTRPDGTKWRIGLRNPYGEGTIGTLEIADCAVITSGNYERYFEGDDGQVYGHILNPDTGYPADSGLASVTVVTPEGKRGDALSTALFVMGEEGAKTYWQEHPDFDMILITEDGRILITEGIAENFSLAASFSGMEIQTIELK